MEVIEKKSKHQTGQDGPGVAIDLTEKQEGQAETHDQVPGFRQHGPIDDVMEQDDLIEVRNKDQDGPQFVHPAARAGINRRQDGRQPENRGDQIESWVQARSARRHRAERRP